MELINDRRPRDWAYLVGFDRRDFPLLMDMARHIRKTHDTDMIENLNDQFENRNKIITIGNRTLRTKGINKTEDLVTNVGLQQCIKIILGTSTARWSQMIFAASSSPYPTPTVSDTTLTNYSIGFNVLPIATFGWSESKGMRMLFATIVPQTQQSSGGVGVGLQTINEMGIYNGTDLLNHEVFGTNPLNRDPVNDLSIFETVYISSCVIEFCPVA